MERKSWQIIYLFKINAMRISRTPHFDETAAKLFSPKIALIHKTIPYLTATILSLSNSASIYEDPVCKKLRIAWIESICDDPTGIISNFIEVARNKK
jgi:hypothetical protein